MAKYNKVGGGSYGVYKKQKEESIWPVIGGVIVILMILGAIFGGCSADAKDASQGAQSAVLFNDGLAR